MICHRHILPLFYLLVVHAQGQTLTSVSTLLAAAAIQGDVLSVLSHLPAANTSQTAYTDFELAEALFRAVEGKAPLATARLILPHVGNLNVLDVHGNSVLHYAVKFNTSDMMLIRLLVGAVPSQPDGKRVAINGRNHRGRTAMLDAVDLPSHKPQARSADMVQTLAELGADLELAGRGPLTGTLGHITPLMFAADQRNEAAFVRLLGLGADVNATRHVQEERNGKVIDRQLQLSVLMFLSNCNCKPHEKDCRQRDERMLELAITKHGAHVSFISQDYLRRTVLHFAAERISSSDGQTPANLAAKKGHAELAALLRRAEAEEKAKMRPFAIAFATACVFWALLASCVCAIFYRLTSTRCRRRLWGVLSHPLWLLWRGCCSVGQLVTYACLLFVGSTLQGCLWFMSLVASLAPRAAQHERPADINLEDTFNSQLRKEQAFHKEASAIVGVRQSESW
ncbi:unnamed protein product [Vitrella brassicaformis CCMP3155]|uniref:Uncharacterized protein n=1 Tax=Vitrella brassicaformis (strain CCMP3155) TaxID=1169540 RepID=A0A0G4H1W2_VITBC|nr:unnamed protein product [Vitrella brassicaformis CCMP3155]|eukprot:CEM37617.1 unnamed protein product [Vitrella brassicaformis CCMP3155]